MSLDYMSDPGGGSPGELTYKQPDVFQSAPNDIQQLPKTDEVLFQALTANHSAIADTVSLLCQNLTGSSSDDSGINCNTVVSGSSSDFDSNMTAVSHRGGGPPIHPIDYLKVYVLSTMTILTIVGNASVVLSILMRR